MLKPMVTYVETIHVIENRKDLILVMDLLAVILILEHLGYPSANDKYPHEISDLLISFQYGVFLIFTFEGSEPYIYKDLWQIELGSSPLFFWSTEPSFKYRTINTPSHKTYGILKASRTVEGEGNQEP